MLAVPAGAFGVLLTVGALRIVTAELPADLFFFFFIHRGETIPIDLRVCAFALLVTAITTVVCTA